MSEQYGSHEYHGERPCLFDYEIQALADLAIDQGDMREADHREIQQPPDPHPYFFRLIIPSEGIDSRWRLNPNDDNEFIQRISIEYNEPMIIVDDEIPMDPWVTVTVLTKVYEVRLRAFVDRMVRYRLSLIELGVCEAVEARSDVPMRTDVPTGNMLETLQALSGEARPLTDDDLQFLRLLLSRR